MASSRNPGRMAGIASSGETSCMKRFISFFPSNDWQVFPWTVVGVYVVDPFVVVLVKHDSMSVVKASERSSEDFSNSFKKAKRWGVERGG